MILINELFLNQAISELPVVMNLLEKAVGTGEAFVLYLKPVDSDIFHNIRFGKTDQININHLFNTHRILCRANHNYDAEKIFWELQGENWSPNGEANSYIQAFDFGHTSMSVGDIIAYPDDKNNCYMIWVVKNVGFKCLGSVNKSVLDCGDLVG